MKILALETSTDSGSVALLDGTTVTERQVPGRPGHSEILLPAVVALLNDCGVPLAHLDAIAFGAGPGAFTGLRLACGVAQGLAMGLGGVGIRDFDPDRKLANRWVDGIFGR